MVGAGAGLCGHNCVWCGSSWSGVLPCAACLCSSRGVPGWWPVPTAVCNNRLIACWGKAWDNYTLALQAHPRLIQHGGNGIISSWPTDKISLSLSLRHLNYPYPLPCEAARSVAQLYAWVRAREITKHQMSRGLMVVEIAHILVQPSVVWVWLFRGDSSKHQAENRRLVGLWRLF